MVANYPADFLVFSKKKYTRREQVTSDPRDTREIPFNANLLWQFIPRLEIFPDADIRPQFFRRQRSLSSRAFSPAICSFSKNIPQTTDIHLQFLRCRKFFPRSARVPLSNIYFPPRIFPLTPGDFVYREFSRPISDSSFSKIPSEYIRHWFLPDNV